VRSLDEIAIRAQNRLGLSKTGSGIVAVSAARERELVLVEPNESSVRRTRANLPDAPPSPGLPAALWRIVHVF
jgi:hypothetical protein